MFKSAIKNNLRLSRVRIFDCRFDSSWFYQASMSEAKSLRKFGLLRNWSMCCGQTRKSQHSNCQNRNWRKLLRNSQHRRDAARDLQMQRVGGTPSVKYSVNLLHNLIYWIFANLCLWHLPKIMKNELRFTVAKNTSLLNKEPFDKRYTNYYSIV